MTKDKEFSKSLRSLMIPIAFQNLMLAAVSAGDSAMLGFVDENAMAAVSLRLSKLSISCGFVCAGFTLVFGYILSHFMVLSDAVRSNLNPMIVYIILSMDEAIKIPWVYAHYKKYKWLKNITRDEL